MAGLKSLDRGFSVDLHISVNERTRDRIDALCAKHKASRGAVIDALLDEHEASDLAKRLPASTGRTTHRRTTQGRPSKKTKK